VTSSFRYAADSYQSGSAQYPVDKLALGHHRIEVSAADNLAAGLNAATHRSTASIDFEIVQQPALSIARAYLFPNPTISGGPRSGGFFVVDAPGDSVNVLIRVYTVTGRHIRTLKGFGGLGQIQVFWDGLDAEGGELGNGVYPFKVHVNAREADGSSSPSENASIEGKVVIIGRGS
jgi:flagellar hook assembly protein FlgD